MNNDCRKGIVTQGRQSGKKPDYKGIQATRIANRNNRGKIGVFEEAAFFDAAVLRSSGSHIFTSLESFGDTWDEKKAGNFPGLLYKLIYLFGFDFHKCVSGL